MNGAIELPGEAAPLSPQQVLQALQAASSQQQNLIRSGTAQLQAWETERGYYPMLQVRKIIQGFSCHLVRRRLTPLAGSLLR